MDKYEAIEMARQAGLDLVEVSPESTPPVCRIMNYGKWLYEQKRKIRQSHKKHQQHSVMLKEIRLRPETDHHDLEIKINHAREFLLKGHKVQFTVFFRGRQLLHKESGYEVLDKIVNSLQEIAKVEQSGRLTGKRMKLLVVPNKGVPPATHP